jgi:hypothetical protein
MRFAIVTYTTSKYSDVWPMHFGQITKHAPETKSYAFSDDQSRDSWSFSDHELLCYKESDPYWMQYTGCLQSVREDYVVYSQEDFILYSDIDVEKIESYVDFLESSNYDYVRMIRCGYNTPLDKPLGNNLYAVNMSSSDAFSMQATLWKKSRLKDLYTHVKSQKWLESEAWNEGARNHGIRGAFTYHGEKKIGAFHHDSIVYPYVCTAINRGKWNIDQYPDVMKIMFERYDIDPKKRGIRKR